LADKLACQHLPDVCLWQIGWNVRQDTGGQPAPILFIGDSKSPFTFTLQFYLSPDRRSDEEESWKREDKKERVKVTRSFKFITI